VKKKRFISAEGDIGGGRRQLEGEEKNNTVAWRSGVRNLGTGDKIKKEEAKRRRRLTLMLVERYNVGSNFKNKT